jgi:PAS domain S-box-containing protein
MSNSETDATFGASSHPSAFLDTDRWFKEISTGVWSVNAQTQQVLYLNQAALQVYERSRAEFEANPWLWREAIAPGDRSRVEAAIAAIDRQDRITLDYTIVCPNQVQKPVSHCLWLVAGDRSHRLEGTIVERPLLSHHANKQLETLANNLPGVIYQYIIYPDQTEAFTYISSACREVFELEPQQIRENSQLLWQQVHPDDLQTFQYSIRTSAQALTQWQHQWRIVTPSDQVKWMSGVAQPERGQNGEIIWDGVMFDISDRIIAQAALRDSETRYQSLIDAMSEGITLLTADGLFQACNPSAQEMLGLGPNEIDGSSAFDSQWRAIDEEGFPIQPENYPIVRALYSGKAAAKIMGVYKPDRRLAWLSVNAKPLFRRGETQPYAALASFTDITERKHAERILRDREAFLRSIYDGIEHLIFVIDVTPDGDFHFAGCNPTAEAAFHFRSSEIVGKTPEAILGAGPQAAWVRQHYQACYTQGQSISYEEFFALPQGNKWFLTTLNPLKDESGRIYRLIGTATEITERKQAEHNLRQREQYLSALVNVQRYLLTLEGDRCCYEEILADLGPASRASRIYVFENECGDDNCRRCQAQWYAPNLPPDSSQNQESVWGAAWPRGWEERLAAGDAIAARTQDLDPQRQETLNRQGIRAILLLPIRVNEAWFGFIAFENCTDANLWESLEIDLLRAAADAIALWQESAAAEAALRASTAQLQRQAQREALLNRLARQIRNSLDLDTILDTAAREVRKLLKIDRATFTWYRPDLDPPCWEVVKQIKASALPGTMGRYSTLSIGEVTDSALRGVSQRFDSVEQCSDLAFKAFLQNLGYTSFLAIPIQTQSGKQGLFSVGHCTGLRPWKDSEVELLEAVVSQLAIAIDQAELYAQTRSKSQELEGALRELRRTQSQLIQTEKMSSLGQMVAGVAHEINNPVNFIYGNIAHVRDYCGDLLNLIGLYQEALATPPAAVAAEIETIDLDFLRDDLPKILQSMQVGAERISTIVKSLRTFSRLDEAEKKAVDLHENIDSALMILQNRLKAKPNRPAIQVLKTYGALPRVECYAGQLNQVFMNLLANAIDTLEEKCRIVPNFEPKLEIKTVFSHSRYVRISITDNGLGIAADKLSRIFDPFYTSKPVGKGTGLGLSISYQIVVERHGGALRCQSQSGEGTVFTIEIPD